MAKTMEKIPHVQLKPASEYFKDLPRTKRKITLQEVRKKLAKFKGSLADELVKMRNEERF